MNKKQKWWLGAGMVLLLLALIGGGTMAYFTATGTANNAITMGTVSVQLVETDGKGNPFPADGVHGVMPCDAIGKVVTAKSDGTADVFVRMKAETTITSEDGKALPAGVVEMNYDTASWTEKDGWFYYNTALKPGAETKPLFTTVTITGRAGNDYMNSSMQVVVTMQAVQSKNNDSAGALGAIGWPQE